MDDTDLGKSSDSNDWNAPSSDSYSGSSDDSCTIQKKFHRYEDESSSDDWYGHKNFGYLDSPSMRDDSYYTMIDAETNETIEVLDKSIGDLEKNNIHPNNNMEAASTDVAHIMHTSQSPQPGCSKNLNPLVQDESIILERTRHVLSLISKIHRDSVFDALLKNPKQSARELKFWDLIPERERRDYPPDVVTISSTSFVPTTSKRRITEDICTTGCKKSSIDTNITGKTAQAHSLILAKSSSRTVVRGKDCYDWERVKDAKQLGAISKVAKFREVPKVTIDLTTMTTKIPVRSMATAKSPVTSTVTTKIPATSTTTSKIPATGTVTTSAGATPTEPPVFFSHKSVKLVQPLTSTSASQTVSAAVVDYMPRVSNNQIQNSAAVSHQDQKLNAALQLIRYPPQPSSSHQQSQAQAHHLDCNKFKLNLSPSNPHHQEGAAAVARDPIETLSSVAQDAPPLPIKLQKKYSYCKEMYYKLIVIFPNVDPHYIKRLCPVEWGPGDRDAQLLPLIEHLLADGHTIPKIQVKEANNGDNVEMSFNSRSADDIYENLLGIFPDADPHYLRQTAEKNISNPDSLKQFVETNLERGDYPTRKDYEARCKITEQQRQYTTGFEVKQYLSIIPDPQAHFTDPKRKNEYQPVAFEFLKSFYHRIRVATISKFYTKRYYNLTLTAQDLDGLPPEMKSKRGVLELPTENITLLQEIAYLKHKNEITEYTANIKRAEDEEFQMLKANNQLIECECCFDNECVPSKCSSCDNGHIFCNICIITGTNAKISEGITRISCFVNCGSEFSLSVLQRVLKPTTFSILLKKRQADEVVEAGLEGLVSCPFCHFASIPPEGDKIFKCLNPECTKESCRLCKEISHVPLKCDEVMKADKARLFIEERMTQALARKCYKCGRSFFKEEGCNKITCPCGAKQCYLCDQPITNYSHFRGQGSDDKNRCPLYSDTIRLDAVAVHKVAEDAKKELLKRDPTVKIDTKNLLPTIPRPAQGPHMDIPNADQLPRRAQRTFNLPPL